MSERFCLPGYISALDALPDPAVDVLVACSTWDAPRVCFFDQHFRGPNMPAFCDGMSGRWFWYPERMCWTPLTDDSGDPVVAGEPQYFAMAA